MDPELAFEYDSPDSIYFERETLVFSLFYIHKFESETQIHNKLQELLKYLQFELQPYIDHYPWYYMPVKFNVVQRHGYWYIYGELIYGDYLNDLWLITKILYRFSSRDRNVYIRLFDQDGEFLLIESFDNLEDWMTPNSGTNRVWINDLKFKIIGNDYKKDKSLSLIQSLKYLIDSSFRLEIPTFLNDKLVKKLENFPTECLENIFVEKIRVSQSLFKIISSKPDYLINAALNFKMKQDSLFNITEGPVNLTNLSKDCYPSDEDQVLKVRVSAFAHLYLKQIGQRNIVDPELEKAKMVTFAIDSYLVSDSQIPFNIATNRTIQEYNNYIEEDILQTALMRLLFISHKISSKEIDCEDSKTRKDDNKIIEIGHLKKDEIMEKLRNFMGSKSGIQGFKNSNKEFVYDSDNYNDDSDYSSDNEDIKFDKAMKDNLKDGDIDEDDFFEFFCKEALHLKDEEIANYRGLKGGTDDNSEKDKILEDEDYIDFRDGGEGDEGENEEMSIDVITNLLQSLQSDGGLTGPSASLLAQLGLDINDLMKE